MSRSEQLGSANDKNLLNTKFINWQFWKNNLSKSFLSHQMNVREIIPLSQNWDGSSCVVDGVTYLVRGVLSELLHVDDSVQMSETIRALGNNFITWKVLQSKSL